MNQTSLVEEGQMVSPTIVNAANGLSVNGAIHLHRLTPSNGKLYDEAQGIIPGGNIGMNNNLLSLAICRMVNLSLEHGNSDGSCYAYVWLGMIAGPHFDDYEGVVPQPPGGATEKGLCADYPLMGAVA